MWSKIENGYFKSVDIYLKQYNHTSSKIYRLSLIIYYQYPRGKYLKPPQYIFSFIKSRVFFLDFFKNGWDIGAFLVARISSEVTRTNTVNTLYICIFRCPEHFAKSRFYLRCYVFVDVLKSQVKLFSKLHIGHDNDWSPRTTNLMVLWPHRVPFWLITT